MPGIEAQLQRLKDAALKIYDEKLRGILEPDHIGEIIAVEPCSGDHVLGKSFREVDQACRKRFGSKPVYIWRVGGGGAVTIGGTQRRDRFP